MAIYHHERIKIGDKSAKVLGNFTPTTKGALGNAEMKEGTKISAASDSMWKVMFLNSERLKYSCKLISCIIDVEYEDLLENLKLVSQEFNRDNLSSKAEYGDYVAEINGQKICIEVNNSYKTDSYENINERNYEYINRIFNERVRRGSKYQFTNVILINLHNFYYQEIDDWYQEFTINDKSILYTDKIKIINIYLPKLKEICYNKDIRELDELERVLLTIYSEDIKKSKEFGGEIEVMEEYVNEAEKISQNEDFIEVYDKEREYKSIGYDMGMEDGHTEAIREIALNMLNDNIDSETISKYTNLSLDEIQSLKKSTK